MSVTRKIPIPIPIIRKEGDWIKTRRVLAGIGGATTRGYKLGQLAFANKMLKQVRRNIRNNGGSIGWPPVSSRYADYKSRLGKDPNNLLVLSGLYYKSIHVWEKNGIYYTGVKHGVRYPQERGGLTVGQVAKILETGSLVMNIPARPLWKPSYRQIGGNLGVKKTMIWYIRRQIRTELNVEAKITF